MFSWVRFRTDDDCVLWCDISIVGACKIKTFVLFRQMSGQLRLLSVQVALSVLCAGHMSDKLRCKFPFRITPPDMPELHYFEH